LEDRCLPSTFYAATASDLIADIKAANLQGGANSIVLTAPTTSPYFLTGLSIAPGDALTIQTGNGSANPGYGDTIDGSKAWRLFDVAQGASLTLDNMTLQNGYVRYPNGFGAGGAGGAVVNQGTLDLSHVLVQNNTVTGLGSLSDASGGGIWSSGSLTVENSCLFAGNVAQATINAYGGAICIVGGTANISGSTFGKIDLAWNSAKTVGNGGAGTVCRAYGGAVYVGGGTVTMSGDSVGQLGSSAASGTARNCANGDDSVPFGNSFGYGGGLCVAGGTVTLTNDSITNNEAGIACENGYSGCCPGYGSGIFIASRAHVYLDSFTQFNTRYNAGYGGDIASGQIPGYYLLPQIGSFTASPNPVTVGSGLTLTASNIHGVTRQVSFYYLDSSGAKHVLGNATYTSPGHWTLSITVNLAPGTYTLYAQAGSVLGLFGDPVAFTLTVR
jgi:hypothetical protein